MNEFQKVVKYCAIAFAIFLSVTIIGGIVSAIVAFTGIFDGGSSVGVTNINQSFDNVKGIIIDHGLGNLNIKEGQSEKVEVIGQNVSDKLVVEKNFNGNLIIREDSDFFGWLNRNGFKHTTITVYLPTDFIAEEFEINAGAGNIDISALKTNKLKLNAGAGNITGDNIVADKVNIEGGVGDIKLRNIDFTDTDVDSGVGNLYLAGIIKGDNKFDCGVGNTDLDVTGTLDDYNLDVEKGLGSINIDGKKYSDINWNNATAENTLNVSGGVGNININFH